MTVEAIQQADWLTTFAIIYGRNPVESDSASRSSLENLTRLPPMSGQYPLLEPPGFISLRDAPWHSEPVRWLFWYIVRNVRTPRENPLKTVKELTIL